VEHKPILKEIPAINEPCTAAATPIVDRRWRLTVGDALSRRRWTAGTSR